MGNKQANSSRAKLKGQTRKRRRRREERRVATADVREAHNQKMREAGHPGWK